MLDGGLVVTGSGAVAVPALASPALASAWAFMATFFGAMLLGLPLAVRRVEDLREARGLGMQSREVVRETRGENVAGGRKLRAAAKADGTMQANG